MSPAKRRVAVDHLISTFAVSQRRACKVVGQPRSTQRMAATLPKPAEQHLRAREGYQVNHKRVQRLCRDEGLRVRIKKRKCARVGASTVPGDRLRAKRPNHFWALDFEFDQTTDCRTLKYLITTDEFTEKALAIEVERSMTSYVS